MDELYNGPSPAEASEFRGKSPPKGVRYFDEHFLHPQATSDAPKFIEFDYEVLSRLLGEANDKLSETDYALMGYFIRELMAWLIRGLPEFKFQKKPSRNQKLALLGRRVLALAWTVDPALLKDESLRGLEQLLGLKRMTITPIATDVRRDFKIKNRSQNHGWNFKHEKSKKRSGNRHRHKAADSTGPGD